MKTPATRKPPKQNPIASIDEAAKPPHDEVATNNNEQDILDEDNHQDPPTNGGAHDQLREMLTEPEVLALTRLSRTSLHRLEKKGLFPRGVYIGPNAKRYFRDRIVAWQNALDEHDHFNPARGRGKGRRRALGS
jgi:predicted DNA-binding transcriptional regulator AlpA